MITIQMLEDQDVIQADDLVRQLSLMYEGQSDYLMTTSTYGGGPINRLKWVQAKYNCPFWVGKTVGTFNEKMERFGSGYEFIRGVVPAAHLERLTAGQMEIANMILNGKRIKNE
jgi:hypothetical protein